jgi:ergothioneine biosynthesis protein EgtB
MDASFEALSPRARRAASVAPASPGLARYRAVRAATERLAAPLSPEDCAAQSMPDASPVKWHLAHTSWFFETFVLERALPGYRPFHPGFRELFNSYYNAVGEQHPRPRRGLLTRPSLDEVRAYRASVDGHLVAWLRTAPEPLDPVVELGLQHEQQHQELILTDAKHLLAQSPLRPAYRSDLAPAPVGAAPPVTWHRYAAGLRAIGAEPPGFHFDNEAPRHREYVGAFELASRPATNAEFRAFVEDGGYERPEGWLADGWDAVRREGWRAPLYWEQRDGAWWEFTLGGVRPLDPDSPVCHVSYYEADAFARWAGARLPSEAEWEIAAAPLPVEGHFADDDRLHPAAAPAAAPGGGPRQLYGDVWEWTRSAYAAYPDFRPAAGALGEYNGKFMCNQMVLRGGSCATPRGHLRPSYRNFFPPSARWQMSGIRLARDAR